MSQPGPQTERQFTIEHGTLSVYRKLNFTLDMKIVISGYSATNFSNSAANSSQCRNPNIAKFVLALKLKMNLSNTLCNLYM